MSERLECTKERPFTNGAHGFWFHPSARSTGEEYNGLSGGGDYESYTCPHCGISFRVELPD
jgi:hypothetical protein